MFFLNTIIFVSHRRIFWEVPFLKDLDLLTVFKTIVPFLSTMLGPGTEVLLHDLTDVNQSVIAIENGFHSGRTVGSPITDLARQVIDTGAWQTQDFLANYSGKGKGKDFVSGTYFIKNNGKLIGLLCINRSTESLTALEHALDSLKRQMNLVLAETTIREDLSNPDAILEQLVLDSIRELGLHVNHMSRADKIEAVRIMQNKGITGMKGAVKCIAEHLMVSEPTIYRYMAHN